MDGLAALVQTALAENTFSEQLFACGGRRGDLVKLLWFDGDGMCLFAKRLERGRFVWPQVEDFYCQLMRCHARMGQSAAVVDVYARMQRVLHERLGIAPSASSRVLYAELLGDGHANRPPIPSALGSSA